MKTPPENDLDRFLPEYQWQTRNSLLSTAGRMACFNGLVHSDVQSAPIRLLTRLRGMKHGGSIKEFFLNNGFVVLEEAAPDIFIVGLICQPWRLSGGTIPVEGPEDWFARPSCCHAKIVGAVGTSLHNDGRTLLYTETRVNVEDPRMRSRFAAYWAVIHPFSAFIRYSWLTGARRIAETRQ